MANRKNPCIFTAEHNPYIFKVLRRCSYKDTFDYLLSRNRAAVPESKNRKQGGLNKSIFLRDIETYLTESVQDTHLGNFLDGSDFFSIRHGCLVVFKLTLALRCILYSILEQGPKVTLREPTTNRLASIDAAVVGSVAVLIHTICIPKKSGNTLSLGYGRKIKSRAVTSNS